MAIIKKAVQAPQFEAEDKGAETAAVEKALPVTEVTQVKTVTRADVKKDIEGEIKEVKTDAEDKTEAQTEVAAEPQPVKTSIVAAKNVSNLPTLLSKNNAESPLAALKDAFANADVEVDFTTFPRLRCEAGCLATPDGKEAGEWIELAVISYNKSWTVGTGDDSADSKKHVRFSTDGKTTNPAGDSDEYAGTDLEEYRQILIDKGFEKAKIAESMIVYGLALLAEKIDFAHMNEVVSVQLASQSMRKFNSYIVNRSIQARMGRIQETSGNPVVKFFTERAKNADGKVYHNVIATNGTAAPINI